MPRIIAVPYDTWAPEVRAIADAAFRGLAVSSARQARPAIGRFVAWCGVRQDPVRIHPTQAARYLAEVGPDDPTHWNDLVWLRRFSDTAKSVGLRASHAFPREVTVSIARRSDDPLAALVARVVMSYAKPARHTVASDLTGAIEKIRAQAVGDDLDVSPELLDRLFPPGQRGRERIWRPLGMLMDMLEAAGRLGPRGQATLALIKSQTSGGNRRLTARWRAFAQARGCDPALVPTLDRERFISRMAASGVGAAEIKAMRAAIREITMSAERAGVRAKRSPRVERMAARIAALGTDEVTATEIVKAVHQAYTPSAHRNLDAVLTRYLDWVRVTDRDPLRVDESTMLAFREARGDHLGATPVRRFLAAWDTYAVANGAKPSGASVRAVLSRTARSQAKATEDGPAPQPIRSAVRRSPDDRLQEANDAVG